MISDGEYEQGSIKLGRKLLYAVEIPTTDGLNFQESSHLKSKKYFKNVKNL